MYRSLVLVLLAACYDDPKIVVHVVRDAVDEDVDTQVCNATGSCDPKSPVQIGTARVFGEGVTALKKDVSIFDDHGGVVTVKFAATYGTNNTTLCIDMTVGASLVERELDLHAMVINWSGPETVQTQSASCMLQ